MSDMSKLPVDPDKQLLEALAARRPPKKIVSSIEDLEQLIILAKKHKVDLLEVEGHKIVISRHEITMPPPDTSHPDYGKTQDELDEELLYYST